MGKLSLRDMKDRICLILPYVGVFHKYFELFLHSIYKNADILDLLILIPDSATPELKTEINFKIPSNVFIKNVNFLQAQQLFELSLSTIFNCKVDLRNSKPLNSNGSRHRTSIIDSPYNLCHYKGFYNLWCVDFLKGYTHWGWIDCDLILGDVLSFYPNIFEFDCLWGCGHFNIFRNVDIPLNAFRGTCDLIKKHYEKGYSYFVTQDISGFVADEDWMIRAISVFYTEQKYKKVKNIVTNTITPLWEQVDHRNYSKFIGGCGLDTIIQKGQEITYFNYNNGEVSVFFQDEYYKVLYAHFMKRTSMCNNAITVKEYSMVLNYNITPPLNFIQIL